MGYSMTWKGILESDTGCWHQIVVGAPEGIQREVIG